MDFRKINLNDYDKLIFIGFKSAFGCANFKECGFKIPFQIYGKTLTDKNVIELVQKGKTSKLKGLILETEGSPTEAKLKLNENYEIVCE
ncbi:MAG: topoisomerase C-terminal repeat-containing protein [Cytophagales bacterium]